MLQRLRIWARGLKREVHAVYLAARDPRVPWYVKALAIALAAYALSPIDLIPDFIPVLGLVDDVILIPIGVWLFEKMIPRDQFAEHRAKYLVCRKFCRTCCCRCRPHDSAEAAVIVLTTCTFSQ